MKHVLLGAAMAGALATGSVPAAADVKAGVDAWTQGDYARAVSEWRPLANAGDPDAQFNLGQAYKLGRGVPANIPAAMEWYRKAAAQGHLRAEDNFGLLLFQQEKREQAMPYLQKSAARGEPRAQYILGTALFNGEFVAKDWRRAYALMSRSAASGLTQAAASLAQMDKYMPADDRKQGRMLAAEMERKEKAAVLAATQPPGGPVPDGPILRDPPKPVRTAELPASEVIKPVPLKPVAKPAPPKVAVAVLAKSGGWRVQLGAFSEDARARTLWSALSKKVSTLSAYQPFLVKGGNVTRLQAGPLATAAEAEKLCRAIKAAGQDCLTKKM